MRTTIVLKKGLFLGMTLLYKPYTPKLDIFKTKLLQ